MGKLKHCVCSCFEKTGKNDNFCEQAVFLASTMGMSQSSVAYGLSTFFMPHCSSPILFVTATSKLQVIFSIAHKICTFSRWKIPICLGIV